MAYLRRKKARHLRQQAAVAALLPGPALAGAAICG
jgi:hypothetical protein